MNWNDIATRSLKTFVQAFAGVVGVHLLGVLASPGAAFAAMLSRLASVPWEAGAVAGTAAVVCLCWNALLQRLKIRAQ